MKYITIYGFIADLQMPIIGLGTWRAQPEETESAVSVALECGYRHFDTAFNYNNEEAVGNAVQKWIESGKGKREDLFITTKLPNMGNRAQDVERFLRMSLERLKLDYVDLYLIHMPFSFICDETTLTPVIRPDGNFELDINDNVATWKGMEEQVKTGLVKAIGLSNFNKEQIRNIYNAAEIKPSVLQVELHAYLQQKELRRVCNELNIAITAYAPLGSPGANTHFTTKYNYKIGEFPDILGQPLVQDIAKRYNKTAGQILLKHLVEQNIIVIPKSTNAARIEENIKIFDFEMSPDDLAQLDKLDKGESARIFDFLFFKGVENHPEYPFALKIQ